uniref:AAA domain-containing protein n=1 Tax=Soboliphyme baturini TaxID=241478 RepID=A0A183ISB3_9BILA
LTFRHCVASGGWLSATTTITGRRHLVTEEYPDAVLRQHQQDRSTEIVEYINSHWDDNVSRQDPTVVRLTDGLRRGLRSSLAEAITLVESRNPTKKAQGEYILAELLRLAKKRIDKYGPGSLIFRVAFTGPPGVGKSTFIETFGKFLIDEHKKKVAVLTIDPSSVTTGGSIMGDVARMQELSRDDNAFVRASATHGTLGGLTKGTHEAVILCEGAGYNIVLVETVGVGQSEAAAASVVDMMVLLLSPAQGDELQGIKRGLMELADLIIVTKADGDLEKQARLTQTEYISALKYMRRRFRAWVPKVLRASSLSKEGLPEIYENMMAFRNAIADSGELLNQRHKQMTEWMWEHVDNVLMDLFRRHPEIVKKVPVLSEDIRNGRLTPGLAAEIMLREFLKV